MLDAAVSTSNLDGSHVHTYDRVLNTYLVSLAQLLASIKLLLNPIL